MADELSDAQSSDDPQEFDAFAIGFLETVLGGDVPACGLTPDALLVEDLALDSLDLLRVVLYIEELTDDIVLDLLPVDDVPRTLGDLYARYIALLDAAI